MVIPANEAEQNQQEVSAAVQKSQEAFVYGGMAVDVSQPQSVSPQQSPLPTLAPRSGSNLSQILRTPSQDIPNNSLSRENVRPKDSPYPDLYIPDGKGSRLSQMSPKHSGMLSQAGNLLFIIRLHNSMEKYGTPFLEWIGLPVISMPWRPPP